MNAVINENEWTWCAAVSLWLNFIGDMLSQNTVQYSCERLLSLHFSCVYSITVSRADSATRKLIGPCKRGKRSWLREEARMKRYKELNTFYARFDHTAFSTEQEKALESVSRKADQRIVITTD